MLYDIRVEGDAPLIMHSAAGLDTRHPANIEKAALTSKKGSNRTASDDARIRELEAFLSIYWNDDDQPTLPASALRAALETGARKLRQGPQVREGVIVTGVGALEYDKEVYGDDIETLCRTSQHTVPVVVQRSRILRTRAKFDTPWSINFTIDCDDELVDRAQLEQWLDIAGRRVGLCDWRPEKSGAYGRFHATVTPIN